MCLVKMKMSHTSHYINGNQFKISKINNPIKVRNIFGELSHDIAMSNLQRSGGESHNNGFNSLHNEI